MADRLVPPQSAFPIVQEGGEATQEFDSWIQVITERSLIIGDGTPEGVVEAPIGAQFMDNNGVSGMILYIKQLADIGGDKTKGWTLV